MPVRSRKPWTVLIYMVADDPQGGELLDQQAVREMDQITKAALLVKPKDLYVALQVDFRTLPGVWRRVIGESTFVRPEGNAAAPETLYGFFEWAARECPAQNYLLVFWGHSRAQFGMFGDSDPFEYTAQTLTLDELRVALKAAKQALGQPVDIIAFKDCFMATLETAYELAGLADYLLASPGLVPVEGWPYDDMFKELAGNSDSPLNHAKRLLGELEKHYQNERDAKNLPADREVPYSLLSTEGAAATVGELAALVGRDHTDKGLIDEKELRSLLDRAVATSGDPALADLGSLTAGDGQPNEPQKSFQPSANLEGFLQSLGNAKPGGGNPPSHRDAKQTSDDRDRGADERLVIQHTGTKTGGVSVFLFPETSKGRRDSVLTRLANEKAYRSLAISADTRWADIALQSMPLQTARPAPDVSSAIAIFEQLQRVGLGMGPASAASSLFVRQMASRSRSGNLTDGDLAEAAEYSAIAELAARLANFAADKGGADFLDKGGADFVGKDKGGADFVGKDKGGADFGPRR